jgi:hypothetical protein
MSDERLSAPNITIVAAMSPPGTSHHHIMVACTSYEKERMHRLY